jgi:Flp pilus assembly protein TadD
MLSDEGWQAVVATDLDDDDLGLTDAQGKRANAQGGLADSANHAATPSMPLVGSASSLGPSSLGPSSLGPSVVPPVQAASPAPSSARHDDVDLAAQIAAVLPPDEPVVTSPGAGAAADTIPDRRATSHPPTAGVPNSSSAPGTVVDVVQAATPIAPTPLSRLTLVQRPQSAVVGVVAPSELSSVPPPVPAEPFVERAPPPPPPPSVVSAVESLPPSHPKRANTAMSQPPSGGGVSRLAAVALMGVAMLAAAVVTFLLSGDSKTTDAGPSRVVDSGGNAVDANPADVGVPSLAVVTDAGHKPAPHDAGRATAVVPAQVADAGVVAVVAKTLDAGVVAAVPSVVDAGQIAPVAAPTSDAGTADAGTAETPEERYAARMKAAEAHSRGGRFAKAVKEYKLAQQLQPTSLAVHLGLGNAYYELDQVDLALQHLEKARALAPREPQSYVLLGAVYQTGGRRDDAIAAYKRYLELAPNGKFARDVRGILAGMGAK